MEWEDQNGTVIYSNLFTIVFSVILVVLVFWIAIFFWCRKDRLAEPMYRRKYGTLFEELDLTISEIRGNKRTSSLLFNILFVIRRFIFALSAILLGNYVSFQIMI